MFRGQWFKSNGLYLLPLVSVVQVPVIHPLCLHAYRPRQRERANALKAKHAIEAQQEELRKQREQMEFAASTAKIVVLSTAGSRSKCSRSSSSHGEGRGSRVQGSSEDKGGNGVFDSLSSNVLNPQAAEYVPMDTAGTSHIISSQSVGATCNISTQFTSTESNRGLCISAGGTCHQQELSYSADPVKDNITASQAGGSLPSQNSALYEILKRQEELTTHLVYQAQSNTLPKKEIPVFDGKLLHYIPFIKVFEHCVEEKACSKRDCIFWNSLLQVHQENWFRAVHILIQKWDINWPKSSGRSNLVMHSRLPLHIWIRL